ncbi:MAG: hypothetical protein AABY26_00905, partial [Nanoarchaeota archaeon]
LGSLEHYELTALKQQIEKGKLDIVREIQEKVKEHEKQHAKDCATCSSILDPYNTNNYTIIFGPDDFRKKASFCGIDCLEYFLLNLKKIKKGAGKTEFSGTNSGGDESAEKIE